MRKTIGAILTAATLALPATALGDRATLTINDHCNAGCAAKIAIDHYNLNAYRGDHVRTFGCHGTQSRIVCHETMTQTWGGCDKSQSVCLRIKLPFAWTDRAVLHGHVWRVTELS